MSNFDKALHLIGMVSGGLVVTAASGGLSLPAWLLGVAGVVAYASGAVAAPMVGKAGPVTGLFGGARNQKADPEEPK